MTILGLIPARSGSKGIPGKNERPLAGRTLVERAAAAAFASGVLERVVLTTDAEAIADLGRAAGTEVLRRPAELALDDTPMAAVVMHALTELERQGPEYDAVALLQPTQPLRTAEHIRRAVRLLEDTPGASSVVSVVAIPSHYAPEYALRLDDDRLVPYLAAGAERTRRQDVEPAYSRDGTIYLTRSEFARRGDLYGDACLPLVVDPDESINLDSPVDWHRAEARLQQ
jgi:CMP-N,N'-diacetyllegionaminic acid synthase